MPEIQVRAARPTDHPRIRAVCDIWWDKPVAHLLPRLFLEHFHDTSLVAEEGTDLVGFLVGFHSPALSEVSYVHFAAVAPEHRRTGLARDLYRRFTDAARADGRSLVRAVTSPSNERSIAFHSGIGFVVTGPHADHDGPGVDRMVLELPLRPV